MNKLKHIWDSKRASLNGWVTIPSGFSAEIMAQAGWDSMTLDMQHGVLDYMSVVQCCQAMQAYPVLPIVRVPWSEPGIVGRVLDAGAYGVIAPMINTADQAEAFIAAARYPPRGARSNGPIRASITSVGAAYQMTANDEVLCIPMVETVEAVGNLDAILAVPGVDAIYVGPSDLGFSMGLEPKLDREEPEVMAIYERLIRATSARGIRTGIHCATAAYARRAVAMGFNMVSIASDSALMLSAARAAVDAVRAP